MRTVRGLVGLAGLATALYGGWLLYDTGLTNVRYSLIWLVGGVVAHDAVLAPVTIVVVLIASRLLPSWSRGPAAVGLVVLGTVTIAAIPVLGRFGARPDNPTLLDRNYVGGWLVFAAIVVAGVLSASYIRRRRERLGSVSR